MAGASDFKIGVEVGFDKVHHKITPIRERARGLRLGELPKILGFPFNISAMTEASDFKIGTQLGFAKAHNKIPPERKRGRGPGLSELPKFSGFPFIFL